jgi:hypothetical protein
MTAVVCLVAALGMFFLGLLCGWLAASFAYQVEPEPDDDFYRGDEDRQK